MSRPKEFSPAQLAVFNERYGNNIEKTNVDLTEKYIIDGIVPRDGLTILAGAAKAGKTTLAMQLIHDIITQKTFLNKRIIHNEKNSTKCLYITNEDSASVCFSRLMAIFGDDAGIEAVDIAAEVPFRYASGGLLDFIEMKTEFGYNLFIIDNFRSFGIDSGIERDFTGARLTERMRWMTDMCKELHISIILIHHTKKDSGNRGRNAADEFAGSNVISSVSDSNIILSRTREQNRLVLHCESKIKSDENLVLTRSSSPLRFSAEDLNKSERDAERQEYLKSSIHAVFQKIFDSSSTFECRMSDLLHIAEENGIKLYTGSENSPANTKSRSVAVQINRFREQIYSVDNVTYTSRRSNGNTIYKFVLEEKEANDDETTEKIELKAV
uniref:AAA family ATPase n=1 Tax=Coprococcus catus TaxID=116085 RepID=UPI0022E11BA9|nr:AAA family ATPase [Coprococcus catus]